MTTGCRSRALLLLCAATLLIAGCSGKEGPTGPTGPQGQQGPAGTANVIYSAWFTPSKYDTATVFGTRNLRYDQAAPQITQAVLDNGVVLTYGKLEGYNPAFWPTGRVALLPITLTYVQGNTQIDTWSAYVTVGNLRINFTNNMNLYSSLASSHSFRYVIIPGGMSANVVARSGISANRIASTNATVSGTGYTRAQLQAMSYEEIRRLFDIPED